MECSGVLDLLRRAVGEGHLIGNHTFSHPNLTRLTPEDIRSEIVQTHEMTSEFEPKQKLFRPPYGLLNEAVKRVVKELNYKTVWWYVDSEDWKAETAPSAWVDVAIQQISRRPFTICLCHDANTTADQLPHLLGKVSQLSNCRFVRYDRCRLLLWSRGGQRRLRSAWTTIGKRKR